VDGSEADPVGDRQLVAELGVLEVGEPGEGDGGRHEPPGQVGLELALEPEQHGLLEGADELAEEHGAGNEQERPPHISTRGRRGAQPDRVRKLGEELAGAGDGDRRRRA
jgi:hypothetical protein